LVELSHDSRPIIGRGPPLGATFLALATVSIALMVADVRYGQLEQVRGWLNSAAYPLQVAIDLPFRAWGWVTGSFADRDELQKENLALTARLRLADLQLQKFAVLQEENRRLREMRGSSAGVAKRAIVASILNVDLDPFRHRVLLDRGSGDGVFKGQAVLDAQGIFGQVWRVNARTSEAILISDAEHAIPVQSNRSGVRTIAVGTGDPNRLSLPFVTGESDIRKGDLLLSTGMGGVFPPGYPVARVTKVERSAKATFAIVEARPTAALDRDREVLLVWFDAPAPVEAAGPEAAQAPKSTGAPAVTTPGSAPSGTAPAGTVSRPSQSGTAPEQAMRNTAPAAVAPTQATRETTRPASSPAQAPAEPAPSTDVPAQATAESTAPRGAPAREAPAATTSMPEPAGTTTAPTTSTPETAPATGGGG
jgi:rod shape-determining protein MreC